MLNVKSMASMSEPATIKIAEHVPFYVFWSARPDRRVVYWRIAGSKHLLQIGIDSQSGRIVSLEVPLIAHHLIRDGSAWPLVSRVLGHPVVGSEEVDDSTLIYNDEHLHGFDVELGESDICVRWGTIALVCQSGQALFGMDSTNALVACGLQGLTSEERKGLAELLQRRASH